MRKRRKSNQPEMLWRTVEITSFSPTMRLHAIHRKHEDAYGDVLVRQLGRLAVGRSALERRDNGRACTHGHVGRRRAAPPGYTETSRRLGVSDAAQRGFGNGAPRR
jgi:hypothetical protein